VSALGSYNVGKDISLDIVDPVLGALRFAIRTDFEATPEFTELKSIAADGVARYEFLPIGHKLNFSFDRKDSSIDSYFAQREAQYFSGQTLAKVTITETIRNTDGSVSVFQYAGVALKLTNRGSWKGDAKVESKIEGMASYWRQLQ
jgi:hypothetical protein